METELDLEGVRTVRLQYADLHGITRGKDIPVGQLAGAAEHCVHFVAAVMTVDLAHNVVAGFETGFEDIAARPDLSTLVRVPWEPGVATCIADLEQVATHEPYGVDGRAALKRIVAEYAELGLTPVIAPELEFYLCEPDTTTREGWRRYVGTDSNVYTVGPRADPRGILQRMMHAADDLGLEVLAGNHEYGRGQFEINIRHTTAVESADRAFRLKWLVKELAAQEGLLATFIGKPWNDDEGSGFHVHLSLCDADGTNRCGDPAGEDGLSGVTRQFVAGVLEHAPGMMALFNPTVNAYRRLHPEALVPTQVSWGHDNRFTFVRVPRERGAATRVEVRVGDGSANPYLAYTAALAAGLDGIRRELEPPAPLSGLIYALPEEEQGAPLPATLPDALAALAADEILCNAVGRKLVDTFTTIKEYELNRFRQWVTDWEFREYSHHL
ncbi:MAG TPA: glutamine synthetase family protein [Gaiellaceae bacterium]|nr:glutamine synthetase family protein [Gaiellaceae bacterium]